MVLPLATPPTSYPYSSYLGGGVVLPLATPTALTWEGGVVLPLAIPTPLTWEGGVVLQTSDLHDEGMNSMIMSQCDQPCQDNGMSGYMTHCRVRKENTSVSPGAPEHLGGHQSTLGGTRALWGYQSTLGGTRAPWGAP